jgi:hypothetical protein
VPARGADPVSLASHAPGAFDRLAWLDEEHLLAGYWDGEASFVDLLTMDGSRQPIGQGSLFGVMWMEGGS